MRRMIAAGQAMEAGRLRGIRQIGMTKRAQ
jgi:hypothetical protein